MKAWPPPDYLRPIWRAYMNGNGVGVLALDPREADWVLEHGATLDGIRYRCLHGTPGMETPEKDGRVAVRLEIEDKNECRHYN